MLVGHVNAEFRRRDKVFPGALCDHHAGLLMEHGGNLWRWLGDGQILSRLGVIAALEVVGHVTILSQEGKELQQEMAEVLPYTKPPYRNIRTEWSLTDAIVFTPKISCELTAADSTSQALNTHSGSLLSGRRWLP